jgi:hypothetical protein
MRILQKRRGGELGLHYSYFGKYLVFKAPLFFLESEDFRERLEGSSN